MTSIELARPNPPAVTGSLSLWDPVSECTLTVAAPSAEPDLFAEYHRGAVKSYARFGVTDALEGDTALCAEDTALFWAMRDLDGRVVGGLRGKGPLRTPHDSHALVEWAGNPGEAAVRDMISDRIPFGVLEMKAAWLTPSGNGDRHRVRQLARTAFQATALLGINFCMATSAAHIIEQWRSSGGVIAPIPATAYPDERYQTKMLWWDQRTFALHADAEQIAAIGLEVAHVHRHMRTMVSRPHELAS
jgi:hypothetical protein